LPTREELWTALQAVFRNFSRDEAAQKLENYKVPYGCIRNMEEVFQIPEAQPAYSGRIGGGWKAYEKRPHSGFNIQ
jgi:crotonobetainyl-CoA:carnitine CoA-transferase CaiB-like acyl-CoA transferase